MDNELSKFINENILRISYFAGCGESYIKSLSIKKEDKWEAILDLEQKGKIERYYDHIIHSHEHDNSCGTGYFIVEKGKITSEEFDN